MDILNLANMFTGQGKKEAAYAYLKMEGVLEFLYGESDPPDDQIKPDYCDLARLHATIRSRKVFTVMEFGVGFSTLVMGHALLKNKEDWLSGSQDILIRNQNLFQLHTVDASKKWIAITKAKINSTLDGIIHITHSTVSAGLFQGRGCHYYDCLPNVVPDFVYLDGPDPLDVKSNACGDWSNVDRVVMSGDMLQLEPCLLPGTCIAIDGRTANARFLQKHFYRNWKSHHSIDGDTTFMELQEPPLGKINKETLLYSLGERVKTW